MKPRSEVIIGYILAVLLMLCLCYILWTVEFAANVVTVGNVSR